MSQCSFLCKFHTAQLKLHGPTLLGIHHKQGVWLSMLRNRAQTSLHTKPHPLSGSSGECKILIANCLKVISRLKPTRDLHRYISESHTDRPELLTRIRAYRYLPLKLELSWSLGYSRQLGNGSVSFCCRSLVFSTNTVGAGMSRHGGNS